MFIRQRLLWIHDTFEASERRERLIEGVVVATATFHSFRGGDDGILLELPNIFEIVEVTNGASGLKLATRNKECGIGEPN